MKVLNLRCTNGHGFEGWFGSEEDYQSQSGRGLVACPLCGDKEVGRLPSAPRLNLSGAREPAPQPSAASPSASTEVAVTRSVPTTEPEAVKQLQALWLSAVKHVLTHTEDVGPKFAEEARRIHYGEAEVRGIRGQATVDEAQALADEGIEVAMLPLPEALKGPVQ